jgi:hypothetical protein
MNLSCANVSLDVHTLIGETENAKDTLCRNVLIYGHCRYEDQGCAFNHDPNKMSSASTQSDA